MFKRAVQIKKGIKLERWFILYCDCKLKLNTSLTFYFWILKILILRITNFFWRKLLIKVKRDFLAFKYIKDNDQPQAYNIPSESNDEMYYNLSAQLFRYFLF